MAELTRDRGKTYACKACDSQFIVPRDETPACCPICRMNRFERND